MEHGVTTFIQFPVSPQGGEPAAWTVPTFSYTSWLTQCSLHLFFPAFTDRNKNVSILGKHI